MVVLPVERLGERCYSCTNQSVHELRHHRRWRGACGESRQTAFLEESRVSVEARTVRGASTRDQILDAAGRLMHVRGYHATSLDDVLREGGVGKGNFYYHFKSKEDLGYAIIDRLVKTFVERTLEPAFVDSTGDPIGQIGSFLDRVVDAQRERNGVGGCPMGNLASELSDVHEGFRQRLADVFIAWQTRLAGALARAQAERRLRANFDPDGVAQFLVAALEGGILMAKVTRDVSVLEKCVSELKHHLSLYRDTEIVPTDSSWTWQPGYWRPGH
jgi:TetR/AcrR family transcriptional regulator, transcriptional repressor for nem operon